MSDFIKKHKFDTILIGVIVLILAVILAVFAFSKTEGAFAVVTVNGRQDAVYPLDKDVEVELTNGDGYNILVIEDGYAHIKEASCPDKLCVNQHKIRYNGETLVCLPNKTTVKVVSNTEGDTDFIS